MAANGPLRVTNAPLGPSYDDEPFDIDVLCAKLEVAKREREEREAVSALRKQVRQAVKDESRRRSRPPLSINPDRISHSRNSSYADQTCSPRSTHSSGQPLSWADVTINIPEHREADASALSPPGLEREGELNKPSVSRYGSKGDASRNHQTSPQSTTKRKPFSLFKSLTSDDTESKARTLLRKDRPEDVAKRRSQTSPLLQTKFNGSTTDHLIDSKRPSMTHGDEYHSMNYISEYAICFDTSPAKESNNDWGMVQSPQSIKAPAPLPIDRHEWAGRGENADGMRSLLNLSTILKKDKKDKNVRARVVELQPPPPPPVPTDTSQAVVPRSRPHTRSQTAPEDLICEAVKRIEQDQRGKKRRSMGAFLQTILLPSQSHHTMSNAAHCAAI